MPKDLSLFKYNAEGRKGLMKEKAAAREARARAKREADTIEIMKKLLGKRLSRQGEHSHG